MSSPNTPSQEAPQPKQNFFNGLINNYVPDNEQTYNFLIPIISFASSCVTFGLFMIFIYNATTIYGDVSMFNYAYVIISAACAVELYYGLRNKNRRQYFFWIILKFIELILIMIAVIYMSVVRYDYNICGPGIFLIMVKIILMIYILRRVKSNRLRSNIAPENLYDNSQQTFENSYSTVY